MTIPSISPEVRRAVDDALAGARGAAAGLGADALSLAEAASELPNDASSNLVRHVAHALQARAQRAALGTLAACAAAARLEAYAHAMALESGQRETRADAVRAGLEAEAERDAEVYVRELETDPIDDYAAAGFDAWIDDAGDAKVEPLAVDETRALYVAAFKRAIDRLRAG